MKATGNHGLFTVECDNNRPLTFKGEMLASVRGRWQELNLYRTIGGQYICQRGRLTQWGGEPDNREAEACRTVSEVMDFFGYSELAKDMYAKAGIDIAYWVD